MADTQKSGSGYPGQMGLWGATSDFNQQYFLVEQLLFLLRTATLVQVKACTNNGNLAPVGTVDVLPLVNMIDGLGNSSQHKTLYKLPYNRIQGGVSAIIMDPKPGDIGVAIFADRDISAVKKAKKQANPGTRRRHSISDGIYLFGVLNAQPTQYVRFYDQGIEVVDVNGNKIELTSTGVEIDDKNNNKFIMDSAGIHVNGVLIDRNRNMSNIVDLTNSGNSNLSGASQAVKLADGSNATKVKGT